jgi:glycerol uptake facilitator protein
LASEFFGEFMGTLILILLGNGVVASVLLKQTKAEGSGWIVITTGWGLAVMCGVFTAVACGSAGAHINPAVTLALAIISGDFSKVGSFVLAQMLGAMAGATLVWIHFLGHWEVTEDQSLKFACFSTSPAIRRFASNFISETIGTFVLVFVVAAIGSKAVSAPGTGPAPGLAPYLVGMLVWAIGLSLGATTGYAINPARDLGPRIAHALLPIHNKGGSHWDYAPVPVAGPLLGAALAALLVRLVGF